MIEVFEQIFIEVETGSIIRPFSESAQVICRGYSLRLQRAITDFGADVSFGRIPKKLKEHYGIEVPVSSSRQIIYSHAEQIFEEQQIKGEINDAEGVKVLIGEMDGSMVPIVETGSDEEADNRKEKKVFWREARLCLVHEQGRVEPVFGATMGSVDEAGDQLANCAIRAGCGSNTKLHFVGDGAKWITEQTERVFGIQASYLVDLYHLCEYLSSAADICAPEDKRGWLAIQKKRMENNHSDEVLKALEPNLEAEKVPNQQAPVRACYRYITNRPGQFNYKAALEAALPIGSGEIESAHRYVIQKRLKIPGAWWQVNNAQNMIALRVLRANNDWEDYWKKGRLVA